jgi:hypothetical protein
MSSYKDEYQELLSRPTPQEKLVVRKNPADLLDWMKGTRAQPREYDRILEQISGTGLEV